MNNRRILFQNHLPGLFQRGLNLWNSTWKKFCNNNKSPFLFPAWEHGHAFCLKTFFLMVFFRYLNSFLSRANFWLSVINISFGSCFLAKIADKKVLGFPRCLGNLKSGNRLRANFFFNLPWNFWLSRKRYFPNHVLCRHHLRCFEELVSKFRTLPALFLGRKQINHCRCFLGKWVSGSRNIGLHAIFDLRSKKKICTLIFYNFRRIWIPWKFDSHSKNLNCYHLMNASKICLLLFGLWKPMSQVWNVSLESYRL